MSAFPGVASSSATPANPSGAPKVITSDNISTLTTYELRQELNRRNAMDIPEKKINYKSLLQRLLVEVLKDEAAAVKEKEDNRLAQEEAARKEALRLREIKKQEAIERSKQRQAANPAYFAEKARINTEIKNEREAKITSGAFAVGGAAAAADPAAGGSTDSTDNIGENEGETSAQAAGGVTVVSSTPVDSDKQEEVENPFAKSKARFKVAVK